MNRTQECSGLASAGVLTPHCAAPRGVVPRIAPGDRRAEGAREPGVGYKKMRVPEGGQQAPPTLKGARIGLPFCAKRGLPSRSLISHESDQCRELDWAWVRIVRPLRGWRLFGASFRKFPCTFGAAVAWGWRSRRRLSCSSPPGPHSLWSRLTHSYQAPCQRWQKHRVIPTEETSQT